MFIILFLVPYIGLLYWFMSRRYLPNSMVKIKPAVEGDDRHQLARSSYKVLQFIHGVLFFLVMLWLPVMLGILFHYKGDFGPLPDVSIYTNMYVDLTLIDELEVSGLRGQVIQAKTEIDLAAPNYINSFIFLVTQLIRLVMFLFVVLQLRNILASLCNGDSFSAGNSQRLNWIGRVIVFAYLVGPLWNFFLSASVINTVEFSTPAISMAPTTQGSLLGLFVGVGLLILSAVIQEAEKLLDEQRYTI